METARTAFMVAAALFVAGGAVATVVLELGSSKERRLVSAGRDLVEVLLPPVLILLLVGLVWLDSI